MEIQSRWKISQVLYTGLMIVKDEPYLIEYNVRMGDPECQTILPMIKTDLVDIFQTHPSMTRLSLKM